MTAQLDKDEESSTVGPSTATSEVHSKAVIQPFPSGEGKKPVQEIKEQNGATKNGTSQGKVQKGVHEHKEAGRKGISRKKVEEEIHKHNGAPWEGTKDNNGQVGE